MHWLLDPFQSDFSQRAGIVCLMVGVLAPVVGTWVSLRRLAYMGDAMSHSLLGGVALASMRQRLDLLSPPPVVNKTQLR